MNFYDITAVDIAGAEVSLSDYAGKVLLIVNTASKCGFTPQFAGLEALHKAYNDEGLVILGFPCNQFKQQDPGTNEQIEEFCRVNYGVDFKMFARIEVNGPGRHPLYTYLIENTPVRAGEDVKWNFEKFLIGRQGDIVNRFLSMKTPKALEKHIKKLL